jgi:hypothetical protein
VVFTRPQPFGEDEFFRTFWENDETVITTKSENKASASPPEHLRIDHNLGLFVSNPLVGWRHTRKEADYLRELHANYKARKTPDTQAQESSK